MADWDANEASRTRVILVDSHVLAGPRCMRAMTRCRPSNRDHQSLTGRTPQLPWPAVGHLVQSATRRHPHLPARSRNSRQSRITRAPTLVEDKKAAYVFTAAKDNQPGLVAKLDALPWQTVPGRPRHVRPRPRPRRTAHHPGAARPGRDLALCQAGIPGGTLRLRPERNPDLGGRRPRADRVDRRPGRPERLNWLVRDHWGIEAMHWP